MGGNTALSFTESFEMSKSTPVFTLVEDAPCSTTLKEIRQKEAIDKLTEQNGGSSNKFPRGGVRLFKVSPEDIDSLSKISLDNNIIRAFDLYALNGTVARHIVKYEAAINAEFKEYLELINLSYLAK